MENKLKVIETFLSIQGEGIQSGLPTYFIRLAGCNLRCSYCDTKYSYNGGKQKTVAEVLDDAQKQGFKLICLTGGEPLLQPAAKSLIEKALRLDYSIAIETNGSIDISKIGNSPRILYSLDIKCPSSGMADKMNFRNLGFISKKDQIKFIIGNQKDYRFSKNILEKYDLIRKTNVIFTPVGGIKAKRLVKWVLADSLNVRIGLQIHKVIWKTAKEETKILEE